MTSPSPNNPIIVISLIGTPRSGSATVPTLTVSLHTWPSRQEWMWRQLQTFVRNTSLRSLDIRLGINGRGVRFTKRELSRPLQGDVVNFGGVEIQTILLGKLLPILHRLMKPTSSTQVCSRFGDL